MTALGGILAGCVAAALLGGVVAAWADAIAFMRAEYGRAPSLGAVLGGAAIFLAGLGGAAVGLVALAMALEVAG
jgi:hypothetical protein